MVALTTTHLPGEGASDRQTWLVYLGIKIYFILSISAIGLGVWYLNKEQPQSTFPYAFILISALCVSNGIMLTVPIYLLWRYTGRILRFWPLKYLARFVIVYLLGYVIRSYFITAWASLEIAWFHLGLQFGPLGTVVNNAWFGAFILGHGLVLTGLNFLLWRRFKLERQNMGVALRAGVTAITVIPIVPLVLLVGFVAVYVAAMIVAVMFALAIVALVAFVGSAASPLSFYGPSAELHDPERQGWNRPVFTPDGRFSSVVAASRSYHISCKDGYLQAKNGIDGWQFADE